MIQLRHSNHREDHTWTTSDLSKQILILSLATTFMTKLFLQEHLLGRKLLQIIDWDRFTRKLIKLYKGEGVVGRPPFDPQLLLKVELIAYLYHLSERQVERCIYR